MSTAEDKAASGGVTHVIACVIEREGRYLICRRPQHKRHGGLWEFPGGKVEPGETMLQAAVRELAEEMALQVQSIGETLMSFGEPDSPFIIEFVPVQATGTPRLLEHTELRWLTAAELAELPLAPTDRQFVQRLKGDTTGGGEHHRW